MRANSVCEIGCAKNFLKARKSLGAKWVVLTVFLLIPFGLAAQISLWKGDGSSLDSVGGNDGVVFGSVQASSGVSGTGFLFNAPNEYIQIPFDSSLVTDSYSVEAWVKPNGSVQDANNQDFIFGQALGRAQLLVRSGQTGVVPAFSFGTGDFVTYPTAVGANEIPIGAFSHLVGTWDGLRLRLYVNGALSAEAIPSPGVAPCQTCNYPFFIGGLGSGYSDSQFFNGLVDEVAFFGRALSASEALSRYEASRPSLRLSQTISFPPIATQRLEDGFVALRASSSSGLPIAYTVVSGPAVLQGSSLVFLGRGLVTVRASQSGNESYFPATDVTVSFRIKSAQTITFDSLSEKLVGDSPFDLSAQASSGLPVSFSVVSGPVSISEGRVSILGPGTATIRASQPGDDSYLAAASVDRTFSIRLSSGQAIKRAYWPGEGNAEDVIGGNSGIVRGGLTFVNAHQGQGFGSSGSRSYVEIPFRSAMVSPTYSVEAWVKPLGQVLDGNNQDMIFAQALGRAQLLVRKGQTGVVPVFSFGTGDFVTYPTAVGASEIPVGAFSHLVGTWDGEKLSIYINGVLAGQGIPSPGVVPCASCSAPFFIGGYAYGGASGQFFNGVIDEVGLFDGALSSHEVLSLYQSSVPGPRASQSISFAPIPDRNLADGAFFVEASASSGLPVVIEVASGPALVSGNRVSLTGAGSVTLRASQPGNSAYHPASAVERTFVVSPAAEKLNQTIVFGPLPNRWEGQPPFPLEAEASSGLPVVFSIISGPAFVEGNNVSVTGLGLVRVLASQPGNDAYFSAAPVERSFEALTNTAPIVAPIGDRIFGGSRPAEIPVSIVDAESPEGPFLLNAELSNTNLVSLTNVTFSANGAQAVLRIVPEPEQFGSTLVSLRVADPFGKVATNEFSVSFREPPAIAPIPDQVGEVDQFIGPLAITFNRLGDLTSPFAIGATSSNQDLLSDERILFSGSDTNRLILMYPLPGKHGTTDVRLTVSDSVVSEVVTFKVTIRRPNTAPRISPVAQATVRAGGGVTIPFTVGDDETSAENLQISAVSSRPDLLNASGISLAGAGESRSIELRPGRSDGGVSQITITVRDESGATAAAIFTLNIEPYVNLLPQVALVLPSEGGAYVFGDSVTLSATATDPEGEIARVEFFDGENKLGEALASPYQIETASLAVGERRLTARVTDGAGAVVSSDPVLITIRRPLPVNDAFASRIELKPLGDSVTGNNEAATDEPGEPAHGSLSSRSVWWSWTAPADVRAQLTTKGSSFDTVLAVYTGDSIAGIAKVASNDDDPAGGVASLLSFNATAGVRYAIAVSGIAGASGEIALQLSIAQTLSKPLRIEASGQNIVLTWPTNLVNAVVEHTGGVSADMVWTVVPPPSTILSGEYFLKLPAQGASGLYRLRITE